jgi:hypothetical protein
MIAEWGDGDHRLQLEYLANRNKPGKPERRVRGIFDLWCQTFIGDHLWLRFAQK